MARNLMDNDDQQNQQFGESNRTDQTLNPDELSNTDLDQQSDDNQSQQQPAQTDPPQTDPPNDDPPAESEALPGVMYQELMDYEQSQQQGDVTYDRQSRITPGFRSSKIFGPEVAERYEGITHPFFLNQDPETLRAAQQGNWKALGNAFVRAGGTAAVEFAAIPGYLAEAYEDLTDTQDGFTNAWLEATHHATESLQESFPTHYDPNMAAFDPFNIEWWAKNTEHLGTTLGLLALTLATDGLATPALMRATGSILGNAGKLNTARRLMTQGTKLNQRFRAVNSGMISRITESAMESYGVQQEMMEKYLNDGYTREEAAKLASADARQVYGANMALLAFDVFQASMLFKGLGAGASAAAKVNRFGKAGTVAKDFAKSIVSEGIEEGVQYIIGEKAKGTENFFTGGRSLGQITGDKEFYESMVSGAFGGGVFYGMGKLGKKIYENVVQKNNMQHLMMEEHKDNLRQMYEAIKEGDVSKMEIIQEKSLQKTIMNALQFDTIDSLKSSIEQLANNPEALEKAQKRTKNGKEVKTKEYFENVMTLIDDAKRVKSEVEDQFGTGKTYRDVRNRIIFDEISLKFHHMNLQTTEQQLQEAETNLDKSLDGRSSTVKRAVRAKERVDGLKILIADTKERLQTPPDPRLEGEELDAELERRKTMEKKMLPILELKLEQYEKEMQEVMNEDEMTKMGRHIVSNHKSNEVAKLTTVKAVYELKKELHQESLNRLKDEKELAKILNNEFKQAMDNATLPSEIEDILDDRPQEISKENVKKAKEKLKELQVRRTQKEKDTAEKKKTERKERVKKAKAKKSETATPPPSEATSGTSEPAQPRTKDEFKKTVQETLERRKSKKGVSEEITKSLNLTDEEKAAYDEAIKELTDEELITIEASEGSVVMSFNEEKQKELRREQALKNQKPVLKKLHRLKQDRGKATIVKHAYEFTKKLYLRVSNFLRGVMTFEKQDKVTFVRNGATVGNYVDEVSRFVMVNPEGSFNEFKAEFEKLDDRKKAGTEDLHNETNFNAVRKHLLQIRQRLIVKHGEHAEFFTDEVFLRQEGKVTKKLAGKDRQFDGIGGVPDMMVIDEEGKVHLYDFKNKTAKSIKHAQMKASSTRFSPKSSVDEWTEQQSAYQDLLQHHGFEVGSINIIMVATQYIRDSFKGDPTNESEVEAFKPRPKAADPKRGLTNGATLLKLAYKQQISSETFEMAAKQDKGKATTPENIELTPQEEGLVVKILENAVIHDYLSIAKSVRHLKITYKEVGRLFKFMEAEKLIEVGEDGKYKLGDSNRIEQFKKIKALKDEKSREEGNKFRVRVIVDSLYYAIQDSISDPVSRLKGLTEDQIRREHESAINHINLVIAKMRQSGKTDEEIARKVKQIIAHHKVLRFTPAGNYTKQAMTLFKAGHYAIRTSKEIIKEYDALIEEVKQGTDSEAQSATEQPAEVTSEPVKKEIAPEKQQVLDILEAHPKGVMSILGLKRKLGTDKETMTSLIREMEEQDQLITTSKSGNGRTMVSLVKPGDGAAQTDTNTAENESHIAPEITEAIQQSAPEEDTENKEEPVSDAVYNEFIDTGSVPDSVLKSIAEVIKTGGTLSMRQMAIHQANGKRIEELLLSKFEAEANVPPAESLEEAETEEEVKERQERQTNETPTLEDDVRETHSEKVVESGVQGNTYTTQTKREVKVEQQKVNDDIHEANGEEAVIEGDSKHYDHTRVDMAHDLIHYVNGTFRSYFDKDTGKVDLTSDPEQGIKSLKNPVVLDSDVFKEGFELTFRTVDDDNIDMYDYDNPQAGAEITWGEYKHRLRVLHKMTDEEIKSLPDYIGAIPIEAFDQDGKPMGVYMPQSGWVNAQNVRPRKKGMEKDIERLMLMRKRTMQSGKDGITTKLRERSSGMVITSKEHMTTVAEGMPTGIITVQRDDILSGPRISTHILKNLVNKQFTPLLNGIPRIIIPVGNGKYKAVSVFNTKLDEAAVDTIMVALNANLGLGSKAFAEAVLNEMGIDITSTKGFVRFINLFVPTTTYLEGKLASANSDFFGIQVMPNGGIAWGQGKGKMKKITDRTHGVTNDKTRVLEDLKSQLREHLAKMYNNVSIYGLSNLHQDIRIPYIKRTPSGKPKLDYFEGGYNKWVSSRMLTDVIGQNIGTEKNPKYIYNVYGKIKIDTAPFFAEDEGKGVKVSNEEKKTEATKVKESKSAPGKLSEIKKQVEEEKAKEDEIDLGLSEEDLLNIDEEVEDDPMPGTNDDNSLHKTMAEFGNDVNRPLLLIPGLTPKEQDEVIRSIGEEISRMVFDERDGELLLNEVVSDRVKHYVRSFRTRISHARKAAAKIRKEKTYGKNSEAAAKIMDHRADVAEAIAGHEETLTRMTIDYLSRRSNLEIIDPVDELYEFTSEEEGVSEFTLYSPYSRLTASNRDKMSAALKQFLSYVQDYYKTKKGKFKKKSTWFGKDAYVPFDEVENSLRMWCSDMYPDIDMFLSILEEKQETHPWVTGLLERFNNASEMVQYQLVINMAQHGVRMKFARIGQGINGYEGQILDDDYFTIAKQIINSWTNYATSSHLIAIGEKDGVQRFNIPYVTEILDDLAELESMVKDKKTLAGVRVKIDPKTLAAHVDKILTKLGIPLGDETIDRIVNGNYRKSGKKVKLLDQFNDYGLFGVIKNKLSLAVSEGGNTIHNDFDRNRLFDDSVFNTLALHQAANFSYKMTMAFRSGDKTISGHSDNTYLFNRLRELLNGATPNALREENLSEAEKKRREVIKRLEGVSTLEELYNLPYNKSANLIEYLRNADNTELFEIFYLSLFPLKQKGKFNVQDGDISKKGPKEHEVTKLTAFLNQGTTRKIQKTVGTGMEESVVDTEVRLAYYFYNTTSDKEAVKLFKSIAEEVSIRLIKGTDKEGNPIIKGVAVGDSTINRVINTLVKSEIDRIRAHMNNDEVDFSGYDVGKRLFFTFPQLNNSEELWALIKDGDDTLTLPGSRGYEIIYKIVKTHLAHNIYSKVMEWNQMEIGKYLYDGQGNFKGYQYIDNKYVKYALDRIGDTMWNENAKVGYNLVQWYAATDFVVNSMMMNHSFSALFWGDPAQYYKPTPRNKDIQEKRRDAAEKKGEKYILTPGDPDYDYLSDIISTFDNAGKRLAADVAPGSELMDAYDAKYNIKTVFLEDLETNSVNRYYEALGLAKGAYDDIESTDAQEFTTWQEHLLVMWKSGTIERKTYERLLATDGKFSKGDLKIILQPMKPVYAGNKIVNGVDRRYYIKSSSFPLLPELTKDLEIDKLRVAMERAGVNRVAFSSAAKVGRNSNLVSIWKDTKDGSILDNLEFDDADITILPRKYFRIQQDIPYKLTKNKVSMSTQGSHLMWVNFGHLKEVQDIRARFEKAHQELSDYYYEEFKEEVGLKEDGTFDITKLQKAIIREAKTQGFPLRDMLGLRLVQLMDPKTGQARKVFETPLWNMASSMRIQSLLMSLVDNKVRKINMPGRSGPLGTEAGFRSTGQVLEGEAGLAKLEEIQQREQSKRKKSEKLPKMQQLTNHSGGAQGSDTMWDKIGRKFKVTRHRHYWLHEPTPNGNVEMTGLEESEGQVKVTKAARQMGRIEPEHQVRSTLIIRNWLQVKKSDAVFAITTMIEPGGNLGYGKTALIPQAKGGTGYAIQMAINEGKPVYVFDQVRNMWFRHMDGKWKKIKQAPVLTRNFAGIGTRKINKKGAQAIEDVYARTEAALKDKSYQPYNDEIVEVNQETEALNKEIVPEPQKVVEGLPEGVEHIPDTGLTKEQGDAFIDLIQDQIEKQAYVENKSPSANLMFSFGLRWARLVPNNTEKSKQGDRVRAGDLSQRPDRVPINQYEDRAYGYFSTDQNDQPLPGMDELGPIKEYIEQQLGIDLTHYDAVLGNIYDSKSFIHQHRDTTESKTAEKYPVVVINLGADGSLVYDENTNSTYPTFKETGTIPLKNGGVYAFGVNGKNRFKFHHRIKSGLESKNPIKPLKLPNGKVLKDYRITLTFRRVQDLTEGVPESPARIKPDNVVEEPINIYAGTRENAHLSNFANRPFTLGESPSEIKMIGKFHNVEAAFQAQKLGYAELSKFPGKDLGEKRMAVERMLHKLQKATGPQAKKIGRQIPGLQREEWDADSEIIMKFLIRESFEQNPDALQALLDTGNAELTHTQDKGKWGRLFPKILMEVRAELRAEQQASGDVADDAMIGTRSSKTVQQGMQTIEDEFNESVKSGFLKDFNITVEEYDSIKESLGFANVQMADLITKVIALEKGQSLDKSVAFFAYKMLGKENSKLRSELSYRIRSWSRYRELFNKYKKEVYRQHGYVKDKRKWRRLVTDRIIIDYLSETIVDYYNNPVEFEKTVDTKWTQEDFTFFQKLLREIRKLLEDLGLIDNSKNLRNISLQIADDILSRSYELYPYKLEEGQIRKFYKTTIESDPKAKEIVEFAQEDLGIVLTGSLALRRAGTVYRTEKENLHDLDFVVPFEVTREELEDDLTNAKIMSNGAASQQQRNELFSAHMSRAVQQTTFYKKFVEKYPNFKLVNAFLGSEHEADYASLTMTGVIGGEFYEKDGWTWKEKDGKKFKWYHKKGQHIPHTGYVIDFFVRLSNTQEEHENYFKLWKEIMIAKLNMGRVKDFTDYRHFVPYLKSKAEYNFNYPDFTFAEKDERRKMFGTSGHLYDGLDFLDYSSDVTDDAMIGTSENSELGDEISSDMLEVSGVDASSSILYTDKWDGKLQPMRRWSLEDPTREATQEEIEKGEFIVQPAQILVSNKFTDSKGNRIDLTKFVDPKTGRLDSKRLPQEVLEVFGFRIPNQGPNSMSYIEIVGFLPDNVGDLIIAPQDFVAQMGSDFDIDKLFSYMRHYTFHKGDPQLLEEMKQLNAEVDAYLKEREGIPKYLDRFSEDHVDEFYDFINQAKEPQANRHYDNPPTKDEVFDMLDNLSEEDLHIINDATYTREFIGEERQTTLKDLFKTDDKVRVASYLKDYITQYGRHVRMDPVIVQTIKRVKEIKESLKPYLETYQGDNQEKILQNRIIDTYMDMMKLPIKEIQRDVSRPLGEGTLAQDAANIQEWKDGRKYPKDQEFRMFSGFDEWVQRDKYLNGTSGKSGVGSFSLTSVFNAVAQNRNLVDLTFVKDPVFFGGLKYDGSIAGTLGNYLVKSLNGEDTRYISEVIEAFQSASVDNAVLQILYKINADPRIFKAISAMMLQGMNETSITHMITQDIIIDFVEEYISKTSDLDINKGNPFEEAIKSTLQKYAEKFDLTEQEITETYADMNGENLSADTLIKMLKTGGKPGSSSYGMLQIEVLRVFERFYESGKKISQTQSAINTDSSGLPKDLIGGALMRDKLRNLHRLGANDRKGIRNAHRILGQWYTIPRSEHKKFMKKFPDALPVYDDFIENVEGELENVVIYLRPEGIKGNAIVKSIKLIDRLYFSRKMETLFPFGSIQFLRIADDIIKNLSVNASNYNVKERIYRTIFNDLRSFINSKDDIHDLKDTPDGLRYKYFKDEYNNVIGEPVEVVTQSLAGLIQEIKDKGLLKGVTLIDLINPIISYDKNEISILKFNSATRENYDEESILSEIQDLWDNPRPLIGLEFKDDRYTTRDLIRDMVAAAIISGGQQQAIEYIKFIPPQILSDHKLFRKLPGESYNQLMHQINFNALETYSKSDHDGPTSIVSFIPQFIQHHVNLVRQIDDDQKHITGITYAKDAASNHLSDAVRFRLTTGHPLVRAINNFDPDEIVDDEDMIEYPEFITVRDYHGERSLFIYRPEDGAYHQIGKLGTFGMKEYNAQQILGRSLLPKNRAPQMALDVEETESDQEKFSTLDLKEGHPESDDPYSIQSGSHTEVIGRVITYTDKPHLVEFGQAMIRHFEAMDYDMEIGIDLNMPYAGLASYGGSYEAILKRKYNVSFNPERTDKLDSTIIHEMIHTVTKASIVKYRREVKAEKEGKLSEIPQSERLNPEVKKVIRRIERMFNLFNSRMADKHGVEEWKAMLATMRSKDKDRLIEFWNENEEMRDLEYAGKNLEEFMALAASNEVFIKFMQEELFDFNTSFFDKFWKYLKDLLTKLGIRPGEKAYEMLKQDIVSLIELNAGLRNPIPVEEAQKRAQRTNPNHPQFQDNSQAWEKWRKLRQGDLSDNLGIEPDAYPADNSEMYGNDAMPPTIVKHTDDDDSIFGGDRKDRLIDEYKKSIDRITSNINREVRKTKQGKADKSVYRTISRLENRKKHLEEQVKELEAVTAVEEVSGIFNVQMDNIERMLDETELTVPELHRVLKELRIIIHTGDIGPKGSSHFLLSSWELDNEAIRNIFINDAVRAKKLLNEVWEKAHPLILKQVQNVHGDESIQMKQLTQAVEDIGWVNGNLRGLSMNNDALVNFLSRISEITNMTAYTEAYDQNEILDELFDAAEPVLRSMSKDKHNVYEPLFENNSRGESKAKLVTPFNSSYRKAKGKAKFKAEQKGTSAAWAGYNRWLIDNEIMFDVRKLFPTKGFLTYQYTRQTYDDSIKRKHIKELKEHLGERLFEMYYSQIEEMLLRFDALYQAEKDRIEDLRDVSDIEKERMLERWELENSPYQAARTKDLTEDGKMIGLFVDKVDEHGNLVRDWVRPYGHRYTITVPRKFKEFGNTRVPTEYYSEKYERITENEDLYKLWAHLFHTLRSLRQLLPEHISRDMDDNSLLFVKKGMTDLNLKKNPKELFDFFRDSWVEQISDITSEIDYNHRDIITGDAEKEVQIFVKNERKLYNDQLSIALGEWIADNPDDARYVIDQFSKGEFKFDINPYTYRKLLRNLEGLKHLKPKDEVKLDRIIKGLEDAKAIAERRITEMRSMDLRTIVKLYNTMVLSYHHRTVMQDVYNVAVEMQKGRKIVKTNSVGKTMKDGRGDQIEVVGDSQLNELVEFHRDAFFGFRTRDVEGVSDWKVMRKQEKKEEERIKKALDAGVMDQNSQLREDLEEYAEDLGSYASVSGFGDAILKYTQFLSMGWNFSSGIANMSFGLIGNLLEGIDGRVFSLRDIQKGYGYVLRHSVVKNATGHLVESDTAYKIRRIMNRFNYSKDASTELYKAKSTQEGFAKRIRWAYAMNIQKRTEYVNQAPVMIAIYLSTKLSDILPNYKGDATLWDAFGERGRWDTEKFGPEPDLTKISEIVNKEIARIHGNYNFNDPIKGKRKLLGRALLQFRTWAIEGFASRFEKEQKEKDRVLGIVRKGRYRSLGQGLIMGNLKDEEGNDLTRIQVLIHGLKETLSVFKWTNPLVKNYKRQLRDVDAANIRVAYVELIIFSMFIKAIATAVSLLRSEDDDEELGVMDKSLIFLLNNIDRTETELTTYINPFELKKMSSNIVPASSVLDRLSKLHVALYKMYQGEDELQSGLFKGQSRTVRELMKMTPGLKEIPKTKYLVNKRFKDEERKRKGMGKKKKDKRSTGRSAKGRSAGRRSSGRKPDSRDSGGR